MREVAPDTGKQGVMEGGHLTDREEGITGFLVGLGGRAWPADPQSGDACVRECLLGPGEGSVHTGSQSGTGRGPCDHTGKEQGTSGNEMGALLS